MKEPLLSSAEVAVLVSWSSVAESSAEKPSDAYAGAFSPDKEAIDLLPRLPLLKLSVAGLSQVYPKEATRRVREACPRHHLCISQLVGVRTEQSAGTPFFFPFFSLVGSVEA
jgi:hypothetical protein